MVWVSMMSGKLPGKLQGAPGSIPDIDEPAPKIMQCEISSVGVNDPWKTAGRARKHASHL